MVELDDDFGRVDRVPVDGSAVPDAPVENGDGTPRAVSKVVSKEAEGVLKDRYMASVSLRGVLISVGWDDKDQVYKLNLYRGGDDLISPIGQDRAHAEIVFDYVCRTAKGWSKDSLDLFELKSACDAKIARTLAKA